MNKKYGFLALFSSAFIYAFFGIFIRLSSESFGPFAQSFLRGLVSVVFIVGWMIIARKKIRLDKKIDKKRLFIYSITPPFSIISTVISINLVKAANTLFYIYAGVLISSLFFGWIWYHEKITKMKLLILMISLVGIFLMAYPLERTNLLGVIFGFIPGVLDSLDNAMAKYLGKFDKGTMLIFQNISKVVVGGLLFLLFQESVATSISTPSILAVIALGVGMVLIGGLYLYGFQNFDLNLGNIVTSVELVILLFLNAIFLKEFPNTTEIIGGLLILFSIVVINIYSLCEEKVKIS